MIEVGAAAREVAHLHASASQTAAVPIPPLPPAGPPPGGPAAANIPRPAIADLYNSGPVVFDAAAAGFARKHARHPSVLASRKDTVTQHLFSVP